MIGRAAKWSIVAGACALGAAALTNGCTLLVSPDGAQCATNRDCVRFAGTVCVSGGCVPRDGGTDVGPSADAPCTSTQDCLAFHPSHWVCRNAQCIPLTSNECGTVLGETTADDVLVLGAMLPLFGAHRTSGIAMERALSFATEEDFKDGIPFGQGGASHPVALVICDESADPLRAAHHLVDDVKVPAILGPARGETLLAVAPEFDREPHVLFVSPYATADLSSIEKGGIVWRTSPLAEGEAGAMTSLVSSVIEPKIRANTPSASNIVVALVSKDDADAKALRSALTLTLAFNGAPATELLNASYFRSVSYGDPDQAGQDEMSTAVASVLTMAAPPDLVIVLGEAEAANGVVRGIEEGWEELSTTKRHPYYLLSHGMQTAELLALAKARADLVGRIVTTSPGADPRVDPFISLAVRYRALYTDPADAPVETFGVAQAYDAFYLLAYGLAAVRNLDIIGEDVRDGLLKIFETPGGKRISVGQKWITDGFAEIKAERSITLQGTAGTYAFDVSTGTSPLAVQTWCLAQSPPMFMIATSNGVFKDTCLK